MRRTVTLDDEIYRRAKALATQRGCSTSALVEASLRDFLTRVGDSRPLDSFPILRQSGGLLPGVDRADSRDLRSTVINNWNAAALP